MVQDKCPKCGSSITHDDWAGPDSGGMSAYCDNPKCGWGFRTILY